MNPVAWIENISVFSLLPALCISFFIFKRADRLYLPFIALIIAGSLTEIVTAGLGAITMSNIGLVNFFLLVEFFLIILLFRNWGFFNKNSIFIPLSLGLVVSSWVIESFIHADFNVFNNYTQVLSSFLTIIFTVLYMSRLMMEKIPNIFKDSRFLISIGFLLYFTFSLLVFIFSSRSLQLSSQFYLYIWGIHSIANISANFIYALGLLCIARK